MIKAKSEMKKTIRENVFGGNGALDATVLFSPEETLNKCRVCSKMVFQPGDSIGPHPHGPDAELYYILEGELTVTDNGITRAVGPGDAVFTCGGDVHEVKNLSDKPATMLAVVIN